METSRTRSAAAGNGFQCGKFPSRPRAGVLPSCGLQNLFQRKDLCFRNQHPAFAVGERCWFLASAVMRDRLPLHVKFKAEAGNALRGPIPHCSLGNTLNNLRGLLHVVKTLAGLLVDIELGLHRGILPRGWRRVTPKLLRSLKPLTGQSFSSGLSDTEKPGAAVPGHNGGAYRRGHHRGRMLTGSAPFQSENETKGETHRALTGARMPRAFMTDGTNGNNNGNGRIDALRERERQIREAIAKETVKRKKREFRDFERLKKLIGGALLVAAETDTSFAGHLKERLTKCELTESERAFVRGKGWLL